MSSISEKKPSVDFTNTLEALKALQNQGIIDVVGAETVKEMTNRLIEAKVLEVHKNKVTERNDARYKESYYYTRIKTKSGSKKIQGTYDALMHQLYQFYYGDDVDKSELCLKDIQPDYELWYKEGSQPSTIRNDRNTYRNHIAGTKLDNTPIVMLDYQAVVSFFDEYSRKNAGKYTRSCYEKTRTAIYNRLEYALNKGIIQQRVPYYRFSKAVRTRIKQSDPRTTWTECQHATLISYLESELKKNPDDPYAALFAYMLTTGDRFETASVIEVDDVDVESKRVYIYKHQTESGEGSKYFTVKEGTKGNSSAGKRYMDISSWTLNMLMNTISACNSRKYIFEHDGRPVHRNTFTNHIKDICSAAGVPYHSPHCCRNYAVSVLKTGNNDSELCEQFGWADKKMPSVYVRNVRNDKQELHDNLDRLAHLKN